MQTVADNLDLLVLGLGNTLQLSVVIIAFGTANGPTRRGPFSRVVWAAETITEVDGPPAPTMIPVRSLETSLSSSPLSAIA